MWAVFKIDQKYSNLFKKDFKKIIGSEVEIYSPKYLTQLFKKNKLKVKEIKLLGDYFFCYNSNLSDKNFLNQIKYFKGFKSFVPGYVETQKEIIEFINHCKNFENDKGYIENNFFNFHLNCNYKFKAGFFTNKIFEIVNFQKNKVELMMGSLKVNVKKKNLLAQPV